MKMRMKVVPVPKLVVRDEMMVPTTSTAEAPMPPSVEVPMPPSVEAPMSPPVPGACVGIGCDSHK
jgi:hypothetical protein